MIEFFEKGDHQYGTWISDIKDLDVIKVTDHNDSLVKKYWLSDIIRDPINTMSDIIKAQLSTDDDFMLYDSNFEYLIKILVTYGKCDLEKTMEVLAYDKLETKFKMDVINQFSGEIKNDNTLKVAEFLIKESIENGTIFYKMDDEKFKSEDLKRITHDLIFASKGDTILKYISSCNVGKTFIQRVIKEKNCNVNIITMAYNKVKDNEDIFTEELVKETYKILSSLSKSPFDACRRSGGDYYELLDDKDFDSSEDYQTCKDIMSDTTNSELFLYTLTTLDPTCISSKSLIYEMFISNYYKHAQYFRFRARDREIYNKSIAELLDSENWGLPKLREIFNNNTECKYIDDLNDYMKKNVSSFKNIGKKYKKLILDQAI